MMNTQFFGRWCGQKPHVVMGGMGSMIGGIARGLLVLLTCLGVFGCSTPAETAPEPTKEDIRNDANRFFNKLEQEKHGEMER
ncbi:MAG: hypothetical protein NPIRA02_34670 [Nitrospirales bacterium]|nr:MAG: hypothetical protein NPIRA02_34670 [Nitrospirales bacterium]